MKKERSLEISGSVLWEFPSKEYGGILIIRKLLNYYFLQIEDLLKFELKYNQAKVLNIYQNKLGFRHILF